MKLHASLKGVFIAHWDHDKLYNYVTYNIEERYRKLFYDLLKLVRYFTDTSMKEANLGIKLWYSPI